MTEIIPFGDRAVLVRLGNDISEATHLKVKQLYLNLNKKTNKHIHSISPAYNSITITYTNTTFSIIKKFVEDNLSNTKPSSKHEKSIVKIPVCYDEAYAPDMEEVKERTGLSKDKIIALHTSVDYLVYMLGFTPGFPYLGGLNSQLQVPRKTTPRLKIDAGSVGLANNQTGIYPLDSPGGWQIIGKTPLNLFSSNQPFPIAMGDYIRFYSISKNEFKNMLEV